LAAGTVKAALWKPVGLRFHARLPAAATGWPSPHSGERMRQALLIVDMINHFDFEGGAALLRATRPVAPRIGALARRFRAAGAPVVYVNDNFLDWRGGFADLVASCAGEGAGGAEIVRHVLPEARDRFVLKPRHSGFLDSPLELLLRQLRVRRVVVTGIAADSCILITAHDAHMRQLQVQVPRDCVAAQTVARRDRALALMRDAFGIDVRGARTVRLVADAAGRGRSAGAGRRRRNQATP